MTDKKKNGWIRFVPSLDLPKERVSIAYDTHDERGVRYAYGYFQFYNGTCGCFWKDGNEQPKVVKAEDIKYWMPVPSLDVQKEPVSDDLKKFAEEWDESLYRSDAVIAGANWQKQQMMKDAYDAYVSYIRDNSEAVVHLKNTSITMSSHFPKRDLEEGDKLKIVVIKED